MDSFAVGVPSVYSLVFVPSALHNVNSQKIKCHIHSCITHSFFKIIRS
jgi:hypothetical protein